jgi:hypothetical protein
MAQVKSERSAKDVIARRRSWLDEPSTDEKVEFNRTIRTNVHHSGSQSSPKGHGDSGE